MNHPEELGKEAEIRAVVLESELEVVTVGITWLVR
jgi:hypothetical protein